MDPGTRRILHPDSLANHNRQADIGTCMEILCYLQNNKRLVMYLLRQIGMPYLTEENFHHYNSGYEKHFYYFTIISNEHYVTPMFPLDYDFDEVVTERVQLSFEEHNWAYSPIAVTNVLNNRIVPGIADKKKAIPYNSFSHHDVASWIRVLKEMVVNDNYPENKKTLIKKSILAHKSIIHEKTQHRYSQTDVSNALKKHQNRKRNRIFTAFKRYPTSVEKSVRNYKKFKKA